MGDWLLCNESIVLLSISCKMRKAAVQRLLCHRQVCQTRPFFVSYVYDRCKMLADFPVLYWVFPITNTFS